MSAMPAIARIGRLVFARHANPWSAWTRWASTPLTLVPIWTRRRGHAWLVGLWLAINPIVFPKPRDNRNWATRAMLGEELWVADRPRDAAAGVTAAASVSAVVAVVAARRHRLVPAVAAAAMQMTLTLLYWAQMARYFDRAAAERPARSSESTQTTG